jgi:hypothetical protein
MIAVGERPEEGPYFFPLVGIRREMVCALA